MYVTKGDVREWGGVRLWQLDWHKTGSVLADLKGGCAIRYHNVTIL